MAMPLKESAYPILIYLGLADLFYKVFDNLTGWRDSLVCKIIDSLNKNLLLAVGKVAASFRDVLVMGHCNPMALSGKPASFNIVLSCCSLVANILSPCPLGFDIRNCRVYISVFDHVVVV